MAAPGGGPERAGNLIWPSLAVAAFGAIWGIYWLPARALDAAGLGGAWLAMLLSGLSTLTVVPLALRHWREVSRLTPGQMATSLLMGSSFALYSVSLLLTSVTNAILLFYVTPVWSTLLGVLLAGERVSLSRLLAIGLGLVGILVILGMESGLPRLDRLGDWLALLAGLVWAWGTFRNQSSMPAGRVASLFAFNSGTFLSAALILMALPASVAGPAPSWATLQTTFPQVLALVLLFVPSNFVLVWATSRLAAARVGILLMTEVVCGVLTSAAWSGEPFGWRQAIGAGLIIGAGLVEVLGRDAPRPVETGAGA